LGGDKSACTCTCSCTAALSLARRRSPPAPVALAAPHLSAPSAPPAPPAPPAPTPAPTAPVPVPPVLCDTSGTADPDPTPLCSLRRSEDPRASRCASECGGRRLREPSIAEAEAEATEAALEVEVGAVPWVPRDSRARSLAAPSPPARDVSRVSSSPPLPRRLTPPTPAPTPVPAPATSPAPTPAPAPSPSS
jgi:hypothetical protein